MSHWIMQPLLACVGSLGYALVNNIRGRQIAFVAIGGGMGWLVYLLAYQQLDSYFLATCLAAFFVGVYAEVMARVNRAPTTIFLTAAAIPLIPGRNLYYMVFNMVKEDYDEAFIHGITALVIALAIVFGFMTVTILSRYVYKIKSLKGES